MIRCLRKQKKKKTANAFDEWYYATRFIFAVVYSLLLMYYKSEMIL